MHPITFEDLETIARGIKKEAKALEGKTLLISGGAGFLGSFIVGAIHILNKNFLSRPCRVISVDNYITAPKKSFLADIKDGHIKHLKADVSKPLKIAGPVDYIIHAAGIASPLFYRKFPLETIDAAVLGVKNLLELARKKKSKSFLFFSSSEIYGDPDPDYIPTPETYRGNVSCIGPRACYDESKRLGETLCYDYGRVHEVPVKIVRPFNVYGPGMRTDDPRVIPTFIFKGLRGETLPVHGAGNQTRTFCYISDATIGFLKILISGKNGEVYNVGSDEEEISMSSLAKVTADILGFKTAARLVNYPTAYPTDEPKRRRPDLTKIKKELGFQPIVDLKSGIGRTTRWFKDVLGPETYLA